MHARPDPDDVSLYLAALICREFPAYKLEDLEDRPIVPFLHALELLETARKVHS